MNRPLDLLTLESVRPGQTAKGSFKNSKSKGRLKSLFQFSILGGFFFNFEHLTQTEF